MPAQPARPALLATALAAGAAVAALAGCGGAGTLNTAELRTTIADQFKAQGIPLRDIRCHDGAKAEKGARVSCTALNPAGTTLVIEGSVTAVRDGKATFAAKAVRGVATGEVVAAQARALLEQRVGQKAAGMTCPARVPIPTTPSVRCVLTTTQGPRYAATVRIDAQSRLNVQLADTALADR
jgi:hypothetical protein